MSDLFVMQSFTWAGTDLSADEPVACATEIEAAKKGLAIKHRVAGVAFFRIDTSASGDQWTEVELLATDGDVPDFEAA